MKFKIVISPEAKLDIKEAKEYYTQIDAQLGARFVSVLIKTVEDLSTTPRHYQERYNEIRIVFTKTFPFGIHYIIDESTITILKVFHTKRFY